MKAAAHLRKLQNETLKIAHRLRHLESVLTPEELALKSACQSSLYEFAKASWFQIEGRPFIDGWHIQAITEHLEALYRHDISDLLINQPFRTGKSLLCSVIYPAWVWTNQPHLRFLYTSYSHKLSLRDSTNCRRLVQSPWYQRLWGRSVRLEVDAQNLQKFDNTKGGYRICTSLLGTNTGFGGDFIVFDDPNNVKQMDSEAIREKTNDAFDYVLSSRYTILSERRRLVIQQRAHTHDVSGHILSKNDDRWVHLCLPMEFEPRSRCKTIILPSTNGKPWTDPRQRESELLWPAGIDGKKLQQLKDFDLNGDSYRISGQLQQRPSPLGGGMLQEKWFKTWKKEWPVFEFILQSWDTAITGNKMSAHSSCSTWGVFTHNGVYNVMLLSLFAGQLEYPELRKMAVRLAQNYEDSYIDDPMDIQIHNPPEMILVEAKASGPILINDLMMANLPVMAFNPTRWGDKLGRARVVSHLIENGLIWLPTDPPHYRRLTDEANLFLEAARLFPNPRPGSSSNDIIDSMSQALIRLKTTGWLFNKDDPSPQVHENWKPNPLPY